MFKRKREIGLFVTRKSTLRTDSPVRVFCLHYNFVLFTNFFYRKLPGKLP